jgi:hypothetical protein
MIDEVSSHCPTRNSEKMLPVLPISIFGRDQPEINLVYQLGGLHRVAGSFASHHEMSEPAQVGRHQVEELVLHLAVSLLPLMQQLGNVAHIDQVELVECGQQFSTCLDKVGGPFEQVSLVRMSLTNLR